MGNNQACFSNNNSTSHLISNGAGEEWTLPSSHHQHQHYKEEQESNGQLQHHKNANSTTTATTNYEHFSGPTLKLNNDSDESPPLKPTLVLNDVSPTYASTVSDDAFGYNDDNTATAAEEEEEAVARREEEIAVEGGEREERIQGDGYDHSTDNKKKNLNSHMEFNVDTYVPENNGQNENKPASQDAEENDERTQREAVSSELGVEIVKTLGDGVSGTVFEVQDVRTGQHYAMKRLRRSDKLAEWLFITECTFLKKVRCKGVIEMVDCFVDDKYYFILTELGAIDLFTRLKSEKRIPENVCREIIFRLLKTLALLHKHNVVHRDVKPENIVFTKKSTLLQPKMIDFGDAVVVKDHQLYNELVGTRCYLSPERWRQHYGYELKASDVWAVGVLTFEMVTGKRCFYASSDDRLTEKIQCGKWQFPPESHVSELCADFIRRLLNLNPKRRPTAEYAMKHPFFTCVSNDNDMEGELGTNDVDNCVRNKHALGVWCGEFTRRSTYFSRHMTSIDPVV